MRDKLKLNHSTTVTVNLDLRGFVKSGITDEDIAAIIASVDDLGYLAASIGTKLRPCNRGCDYWSFETITFNSKLIATMADTIEKKLQLKLKEYDERT